MIGSFTVGAINLAVAAVVTFGSDRFLKKTQSFVVFFDGSVKGLDIGAPVSFRGVRVGSVSDVVLLVDPVSGELNIKVIVDLEEREAKEHELKTSDMEFFEKLLERGLRAQLETQSMLTGKLYVDLDFHPLETEMNLVGLDKTLLEIPAVPTDMQRLQQTVWSAIDEIRGLPIEEIFQHLQKTLEGVERMVNDPQSRQVLDSLETTIQDIRDLMQNLNASVTHITTDLGATLSETQKLVYDINQRVDPIADGVEGTVTAAHSALEKVDRILALDDEHAARLIGSLTNATTAARDALEQANRTLAQYEKLASEDSRLYFELSQALTELAGAARSVRMLSDYLERHPEALLKGKGAGEGGY